MCKKKNRVGRSLLNIFFPKILLFSMILTRNTTDALFAQSIRGLFGRYVDNSDLGRFGPGQFGPHLIICLVNSDHRK